MDETSPLRTQRCILRPATPADYDAVESAVTAPGFPSALPLVNLYRQQKLHSWLDANIARSTEKTACLLSIDLLTGEQCIGQVSLSQKPGSTSWNLAFWLHPAHWGKGLAAEAARATVNYGLTVLNIVEIWAGAAEWNERSMKTLREIGLRPTLLDTPTAKASLDSVAIHAFSISREAWLK